MTGFFQIKVQSSRNSIPGFLLSGLLIFSLAFSFSHLTFDPTDPFRLFLWPLILVAWLGFGLIQHRGFGLSLLRLPRIVLISCGGVLFFQILSLNEALIISEGWPVLTVSLCAFVSFWFFKAYCSPLAQDIWMSLAGLGMALVGLLQISGLAGMDIPPYEKPAFGTMGHQNLHASGLFLCLPFCCNLLLRRKAFLTGLGLASTFAILGNFLLSDARQIWFALGFAFLAVLYFIPDLVRAPNHQSPMKPWLKRCFRLSPVFILLFGLFLFLSHPATKPARDNIGTMWSQGALGLSPHTNSLEERVVFWKHSLDMIRDQPLLGHGVGNWKFEAFQYGIKGFRNEYGSRYYFHPHQDFLERAAESGVISMLLYLALLLAGLVACYRHIRNGAMLSGSLTGLFIFCGLLGFIVISLMSFPGSRVFHSMACFMLLARAFSFPPGRETRVEREVDAQVVNKAFTILPVVLILVGLALLSWINFQRLRSELLLAPGAWDTGQARKQEPRLAEVAYQSLIFETDPANLLPLPGEKALWESFQNDTALGPLAGLKQGLSLFPDHFLLRYQLGHLQELSGHPQLAVNSYARILEKFPDYGPAGIALIRLKLEVSDFVAADSLVKNWRGIYRSPRFRETMKAYLPLIQQGLQTKKHP